MRVFARAYLCGAELDPGEVKRLATTADRGCLVQTAAGRSASNLAFVEMIAAQTVHAEATGSMLARKPELDLLLRLAGTTQISRALRENGAVKGEPFLLMVAGRGRRKGIPGLSAPQLPRRALSKSELDRVERAALLSAERA